MTPPSRLQLHSPMDTRHLWSVDTVRAYGVLSVVFVHCLDLVDRQATGNHGASHLPGQLGLDVFFVISGLLVWLITRDRRPHPAEFMFHRVTRLAPLYTILTLAYVPFLNIMPIKLGQDDIITPGHVLASLMFIPHFNAGGGLYPLLGPGWTLVYDIFYFSLFSVVLAFPVRLQLFASVVLFSLLVCVHWVFHPTSAFGQVYTSPRALSFLLGIIVAELYVRDRLLPLAFAKGASIVASAAYIALMVLQVPYFRSGVVLWMAAAALSVYAALSVQRSGSTWGRLPFSGSIGRWSYGIYLIQAFVIPASMLLPGPAALNAVAGFALSIVAGRYAHEWIEAPINKALAAGERRLGLRPKRLVTVAP